MGKPDKTCNECIHFGVLGSFQIWSKICMGHQILTATACIKNYKLNTNQLLARMISLCFFSSEILCFTKIPSPKLFYLCLFNSLENWTKCWRVKQAAAWAIFHKQQLTFVPAKRISNFLIGFPSRITKKWKSLLNFGVLAFFFFNCIWFSGMRPYIV